MSRTKSRTTFCSSRTSRKTVLLVVGGTRRRSRAARRGRRAARHVAVLPLAARRGRRFSGLRAWTEYTRDREDRLCTPVFASLYTLNLQCTTRTFSVKTMRTVNTTSDDEDRPVHLSPRTTRTVPVREHHQELFFPLHQEPRGSTKNHSLDLLSLGPDLLKFDWRNRPYLGPDLLSYGSDLLS
jgi:hypothetical protein